MKVTPKYLVKGALYALGQCGILLADAVVLINKKSYSSAVVLAAFSREELGRYRILINFFDEIVKKGQTVTLEDINKACKEHVVKQKWGQISTTLRFQNDSETGKLIMTRTKLLQSGQHQSEEFKEIEKKMADITESIRKRTPNDRHKARMEALYVEPDNSGTDWNTPKRVSPEFARNFVADASGDYAILRQILEPSTSSNAEFTKELLKWKDKPEIPLPKWPN
jgi:AbiV family abortive infection protein